jgi:alkylhydroperoxidase family enzyme
VQLAPHEVDALRVGDASPFDAQGRAALALADALPYNHHQVTDDEVARVRAVLGEAGTVALLTAIAFFDVECRLRRVLGVQP